MNNFLAMAVPAVMGALVMLTINPWLGAVVGVIGSLTWLSVDRRVRQQRSAESPDMRLVRHKN